LRNILKACRKEGPMKRIEVTMRPFKVDEVKAVLVREGIQGITFSEVRALSQQNGYVKVYRGIKYIVDILPRVRIELLVEDDEVRQVTDVIIATLRTGCLCDGEIAILPVEDVIRLRTGRYRIEAN
jgi:nitrogen regulatory protein P-II 1